MRHQNTPQFEVSLKRKKSKDIQSTSSKRKIDHQIHGSKSPKTLEMLMEKHRENERYFIVQAFFSLN